MPLSIVPAFRPVVDGYFLPDTPENLAIKGPINAKHFLTGATKDEGLIFGKVQITYLHLQTDNGFYNYVTP